MDFSSIAAVDSEMDVISMVEGGRVVSDFFFHNLKFIINVFEYILSKVKPQRLTFFVHKWSITRDSRK